MGVPRFYRWLSERYPLINQVVLGDVRPDFDNLYLDMNGILHQVSHPMENPNVGLDERKLVDGLFEYLDKVVRLVRPRKLIYMAVDGVAPRAKMNQQRQRRFRAARDRRLAISGELTPEERKEQMAQKFDYNVISPGTGWMDRMGKWVNHFIAEKTATDSAWRNLRVIFSGHDVPGEGEHKIMDFLRCSRMQPDHDPNTRHCIYGLDADLVMLGLASHEPHFALLREEVLFGKRQKSRQTQRRALVNDDSFQLLHLGVLRQYLDSDIGAVIQQKLQELKETAPTEESGVVKTRQHTGFEYSLERVIDDFVFLCFFVGNDFIPHNHSVDIGDGGLDRLIELYKSRIVDFGGYLVSHDTEGTHISWARVELLLHELTRNERDHYVHALQDEVSACKQRQRRAHHASKLSTQETEAFEQQMSEAMQAVELVSTDSVDYADHYYRERWEDAEMCTTEGRRKIALSLVEALTWNLDYYYKGCPSWTWFYPHHYTPLLSDMKDLVTLASEVKFEVGEPFLPVQQLMAVLPSDSAHAVPKCCRPLMEANSPIAQFYPLDFEVDMRGCTAPWMGVVKVPFVDEKLLVAAVNKVMHQMTQDERRRNTPGLPVEMHCDVHLFRMLLSGQIPQAQRSRFCVPSPNRQIRSDIENCCVVARPFSHPAIPGGAYRPVLLPGVSRSSPGWPDLLGFKLRPKLRKVQLDVFGSESRKETLVLHIDAPETTEEMHEKMAETLIGRDLWIGWPHLSPAILLTLIDDKYRYTQEGKELLTPPERRQFGAQAERTRAKLLKNYGIDCGKVRLLAVLRPLERVTRDNEGALKFTYVSGEDEWLTVPWQTVSPVNASPHPLFRMVERELVAEMSQETRDLQKLLPLDNAAFSLSRSKGLYGALGVVTKHERSKATLHVTKEEVTKLNKAVSCDTKAMAHRLLLENREEKLFNMRQVANMLDVNQRTAQRLLGAAIVRHGNDVYQLGTNLGHYSNRMCLPGFSTFRGHYDRPALLYTKRAVEFVQNFAREFPTLLRMFEADPAAKAFKLRHVAQTLLFEQTRDLPSFTDPAHPCMHEIEVSSAEESTSVSDEDAESVSVLTEQLEVVEIEKPSELKLTNHFSGDECWMDLAKSCVKKAQAFLKAHVSASMQFVSSKTFCLAAHQIAAMGKYIEIRSKKVPTAESDVTLQVLLSQAQGADMSETAWSPTQDVKYVIGDRVRMMRSDVGVALGAIGTVVGFHLDTQVCEVFWDEAQISGSTLGGRCPPHRGSLVSRQLLLNLSTRVTPRATASSRFSGNTRVPHFFVLPKKLQQPKPVAPTAETTAEPAAEEPEQSKQEPTKHENVDVDVLFQQAAAKASAVAKAPERVRHTALARPSGGATSTTSAGSASGQSARVQQQD